MSVTPQRRVLTFDLGRPKDGVRVMRLGLQQEVEPPFLQEVSPWLGKQYDPRVEAPHLLQEFTQLPYEAEAYAHFASQWGLLGFARMFPAEPDGAGGLRHRPPEPGDSGSAPLEAVPDWELAIREVRAVGELHGALVAGDRDKLHELVEIDDEGWVWFGDSLREPTDELRGVMGERHPDEVEPWDEDYTTANLALAYCATVESDGDLESDCWRLLAEAVNSRTEDLIGYGLRAVDPRKPSELRLELTPKGQLYGWLWLQLAEQIALNMPMQRCANCSTWFFQNPGARRQHGLYCTTRCRVAAWRRRERKQQTTTA